MELAYVRPYTSSSLDKIDYVDIEEAILYHESFRIFGGGEAVGGEVNFAEV